MDHDFFIDTSGMFSFLIKNEAKHGEASTIVTNAIKGGRRLITTDYVIDETATLLRVRGYGYIVPNLFDSILSSKACRMEWMDREYFDKTKALFLKYLDHKWSFTDCFSFICMRAAGISEAVTNDEHFREAGFIPLLV